MHPGPINRGVELTSEVADSDRSIILEQVENGVAVRMAVLYLLASAIDREGKIEAKFVILNRLNMKFEVENKDKVSCDQVEAWKNWTHLHAPEFKSEFVVQNKNEQRNHDSGSFGYQILRLFRIEFHPCC